MSIVSLLVLMSRGETAVSNQLHAKLPAYLPLGAVIIGRFPSRPLLQGSLLLFQSGQLSFETIDLPVDFSPSCQRAHSASPINANTFIIKTGNEYPTIGRNQPLPASTWAMINGSANIA
ncbi:MAG: hypothetical protein GY796_15280 [Chloroflexi bacterium]|nr:hypothetical protein [Chloroflexota bacterium]